jgi:hypothetical protein
VCGATLHGAEAGNNFFSGLHPGRNSLAAGFQRLRYASAPANIQRASGAEKLACGIFPFALPGRLITT